MKKTLTLVLLCAVLAITCVILASCGGETKTTQAPTTTAKTVVTTAPAHVHVEQVVPAVDATCTAAGSTEGKTCADCGEILVAVEEIPMLAHDIITIEAVDPTCAKKGHTEGKQCSVCGYYEEKPEDLYKKHEYKLVGSVESTCTSTGSTGDRVCKDCGNTIPGATLAMLAHNYQGGFCVECDATEPPFDVIKQNGTFAIQYDGETGKATISNSTIIIMDTPASAKGTYTAVVENHHTEEGNKDNGLIIGFKDASSPYFKAYFTNSGVIVATEKPSWHIIGEFKYDGCTRAGKHTLTVTFDGVSKFTVDLDGKVQGECDLYESTDGSWGDIATGAEARKDYYAAGTGYGFQTNDGVSNDDPVIIESITYKAN